jgi:DNA invertase Pin-like site-specific DNA recombinase
MLYGYALVPAIEHDARDQLNALRGAGCDQLYIDRELSAGAARRPSLDRLIRVAKQGDVLVVWRLDRIGRSIPHLVRLLMQLADQNIGFRSLTEAVDSTNSDCGLYRILRALHDFELALILERTRTGLAQAKQRGTKLGRKRKLTPEQVETAKRLIDIGESPRQVAREFKVSIATLYRLIPAAASSRNSMDLFSNYAQQ